MYLCAGFNNKTFLKGCISCDVNFLEVSFLFFSLSLLILLEIEFMVLFVGFN